MSFTNKITQNKVGDFYWSYADILRTSVGVNESVYDQRIMAFMALKLLVDNNFVKFNFDYKNNFNLKTDIPGNTTKEKFEYIITNIISFSSKNELLYQDGKLNPNRVDNIENILIYFNHKKVFPLISYIEELSNEHLENVLDIYINQANFINYPTDKYKDLYEETIARMKKLAGDLTGQHFTQKSIIHLMTKINSEEINKSKKIGIYDPTCGVAAMLIEGHNYIKENYKSKEVTIYGQEMHGQTWLLAKIFLAISKIENVVAYGNTLTEPFFANGNNFKEEDFIFIIANPPFGVDWGHEENKIRLNMESSQSHFHLVKENEKNVLPKKSDGQFLFFFHIINILKSLKSNNVVSKAGIISSGSLASMGNENSSENKIRKNIIGLGMLQGIIEQPNAMFTNTDLGTHIWFFDNQIENTKSIKILTCNSNVYKLYSPHPNTIDKMKNTYTNSNICDIISFFNTVSEYVSVEYDCKNGANFNISNIISKKKEDKNISLLATRNELINSIQELSNFFKV